MKRLVILAAVVVLASGVALSAVGQQGKGKGKGQNNTAEDYTLEWSMVADYNGNQGPDWGEKITFKVWTSETTQPHVQLVCFQDGDVVYGALWPLTSVLTLVLSLLDIRAPAECTARLDHIEGVKSLRHWFDSVQRGWRVVRVTLAAACAVRSIALQTPSSMDKRKAPDRPGPLVLKS